MMPGVLITAGGGGRGKGAIEVASSGGGVAVPAGTQAYITVPRPLTVTGWDLLSSAVDTFTYLVGQTTYANFPAGFTNLFVTAPALAAVQKNQARALSIAVAAGQILQFVISGGPPASHQITLALYVSG